MSIRNNFLRSQFRFLIIAIAAVLAPGASITQGQSESSLPPDVRTKVDNIVHQTLADTGVPSASVAIVKDGHVAYVHAYGDAHLDPRVPAQPGMRYSIGSISKQFTSTAILILAEQGKLSLDDPVAKFLPNLTRANQVTIRELLSHTSGYQDYWPQDYVMPNMLQPVTSEQILDTWARKPLDFDPGTKWQYSNTNYVIAGVIIEKVSGEPLLQFLQEHVFAPLAMTRIANVDQKALGDTDATGYTRFALGPPRLAPKEGPGWLFAAGELAMPAEELAKWDIAMMDQRLLKPASYREMQTEVKLKNGDGTNYALGLQTGQAGGHRTFSHGGEVSGFTSQNIVFPDDHAAVTVLTNQDAAGAAGAIARQVSALILGGAANPAASEKELFYRKIFEGLQQGKIDRSLFTSNANYYFSEQALHDFASSLGPLGAPQQFNPTSEEGRGGMIFRVYRSVFPNKTLSITIYEMPDGKVEQFLVIAN